MKFDTIIIKNFQIVEDLGKITVEFVVREASLMTASKQGAPQTFSFLSSSGISYTR